MLLIHLPQAESMQDLSGAGIKSEECGTDWLEPFSNMGSVQGINGSWVYDKICSLESASDTPPPLPRDQGVKCGAEFLGGFLLCTSPMYSAEYSKLGL